MRVVHLDHTFEEMDQSPDHSETVLALAQPADHETNSTNSLQVDTIDREHPKCGYFHL